MLTNEVISILNNELASGKIQDYCPNGLQVEGSLEISKVVTGVTASLALIERAIELKADAILVHHGYFWKGENQAIQGMKKDRLKKLLTHNINLIAYHLPLDVHPSMGNNAQLAEVLGIKDVTSLASISPVGIVMTGLLPKAMSHKEFAKHVENRLQRQCVSVGEKSSILRIAWCTGGGQSFIDQVASINMSNVSIDAFVSGEISEQTTHSAIEQGIDFFSVGHHASERYGVKRLGEWLADEYKLDVSFVDIDNPA